MRSLPLPVRVTAGLVATAAECGRRLPNYVLGLPITIASQALQVSMRIQQQITQLALKGDEALSGWRPTEDQPEWATFDEDHAPEQETTTDEEEDTDDKVSDEDVTAADDVCEVPVDYEELTMPQLRGRLRRLSASQLAAMLDYERAHAARPEILRMLSNRLDKLRSEETSDL